MVCLLLTFDAHVRPAIRHSCTKYIYQLFRTRRPSLGSKHSIRNNEDLIYHGLDHETVSLTHLPSSIVMQSHNVYYDAATTSPAPSTPWSPSSTTPNSPPAGPPSRHSSPPYDATKAPTSPSQLQGSAGAGYTPCTSRTTKKRTK